MNQITAHTTRLLLALFAFANGSLGAIQAYDGFAVPKSYQADKSLNGLAGGSGFGGAWAVDTTASAGNAQRYLAAAESPTYTDIKGRELQTQAGSMKAVVQGAGAAALTRELKKELTGTIWISFLTRMDAQVGYGWDIQFSDATGEMQAKVMNGRMEQNRWRIQSLKTETGKAMDGLFKSSPGMTPTDPTLVLLRIENAGSGKADGTVTAYLNPVDLRDAEISAAGSLKIAGLQLNAIKKFVFDKKTGAEGYIDELRFGETLSDVIPLQ